MILEKIALLLLFLLITYNIFKKNSVMAWVSGISFITYALVVL